jgi:nicotinamide mononucleotide (NMN) deamidase PncC
MSGMENRIERIQASGKKAVLVFTGGGVEALALLLKHPGASRFVLDASIPYSSPALIDYLGEDVYQSVCPETAQLMADMAYAHGLRLDPFSELIAVSCTAALKTSRHRRGDDVAHLCLRTKERSYARKVELPDVSRELQESFLSNTIIQFMIEYLGV